MQYGNEEWKAATTAAASMFKSYYVVWKPDTPGNIKVTDIGLNRTMQYGNFGTRDILFGNGLSLNRTMQYGNQKAKLERNCLTNV